MNCPEKKQLTILEHGDIHWLPSEAFMCDRAACARWDSDRECCGMLPYKEVVISGGINTHQY